jgi:hypothetical protein
VAKVKEHNTQKQRRNSPESDATFFFLYMKLGVGGAFYSLFAFFLSLLVLKDLYIDLEHV